MSEEGKYVMPLLDANNQVTAALLLMTQKWQDRELLKKLSEYFEKNKHIRQDTLNPVELLKIYLHVEAEMLKEKSTINLRQASGRSRMNRCCNA